MPESKEDYKKALEVAIVVREKTTDLDAKVIKVEEKNNEMSSKILELRHRISGTIPTEEEKLTIKAGISSGSKKQ